MKSADKNSQQSLYYSGGLAEVIDHPSQITFSYFQKWFTGRKSVGKAMQLLNLPYLVSDAPLLELQDGEVVVNLRAEEETLYTSTVFSYHQQLKNNLPQLQVSWKKMVNPLKWPGTLNLLLAQSRWIGQPDMLLHAVKKWLTDYLVTDLKNFKVEEHSSVEFEVKLATDVWPVVIATGLLAEFYHHFLLQENNTNDPNLDAYCSSQIAANDWFFASISAQHKVASGELSFTDFINLYGIRADNDYELTCPRWNEIPDVLKKRINAVKSPPYLPRPTKIEIHPSLKKVADIYSELQILRSEAKKYALEYMALLRASLLKERIISKDAANSMEIRESHVPMTLNTFTAGKGIPVSVGIIAGTAQHINSNESIIPENTIGIFPNASPQFAAQYAQCHGLVFLKGGQTSHGSIVAREFKIPAIISANAASIPDGKTLQIDGSTGSWKII